MLLQMPVADSPIRSVGRLLEVVRRVYSVVSWGRCWQTDTVPVGDNGISTVVKEFLFRLLVSRALEFDGRRGY